jgi:hypothetical protein
MKFQNLYAYYEIFQCVIFEPWYLWRYFSYRRCWNWFPSVAQTQKPTWRSTSEHGTLLHNTWNDRCGRKRCEPSKQAPALFCKVSFRSLNYCVIYLFTEGLLRVSLSLLLKPLLRFVGVLFSQTFFSPTLNMQTVCSSEISVTFLCVCVCVCVGGGGYFTMFSVATLCSIQYTSSWSQWPRGIRHELPSPARTLGSCVRIPLKAWMSVCAFYFCVCVALCVGSGLATGWSLIQGVIPSV